MTEHIHAHYRIVRRNQFAAKRALLVAKYGEDFVRWYEQKRTVQLLKVFRSIGSFNPIGYLVAMWKAIRSTEVERCYAEWQKKKDGPK